MLKFSNLVILCVVLYPCYAQDIFPKDWKQFTLAKNFTGKVVLVSESSNGTGRVIAALFSSLGAKVVVTGSEKDKVRQTAKELQQLSPYGLKVSL